jgi:rod shape-determining protein MreD
MRRPTPWRRLDAASRYVFPFGMLAAGLFVLGVNFGLPGQAQLRPVYAVACVFFWTLYRPSSMPAPLVGLSGLLLDLLGISPLGLWALLLLALHGVVLASRRRLVPQGFLFTWPVYSGLAAGVFVLAWGAESLLALSPLPVLPVVTEIGFATLLYPALAAFFVRAHRSAAAAELA